MKKKTSRPPPRKKPSFSNFKDADDEISSADEEEGYSPPGKMSKKQKFSEDAEDEDDDAEDEAGQHTLKSSKQATHDDVSSLNADEASIRLSRWFLDSVFDNDGEMLEDAIPWKVGNKEGNRSVCKFMLENSSFFSPNNRDSVNISLRFRLMIPKENSPNPERAFSDTLGFWKGHKGACCGVVAAKSPSSLTFSGGVRTLLSVGKDNCILLWDLETMKKTVFADLKHSEFQDDSNVMGGGFFNGKASGGKGVRARERGSRILCVCDALQQPDVFATGNSDGVVSLWDSRVGGKVAVMGERGSRRVAVLKGHKDAVTSVCGETDSSMDRLISASRDNTLKIWSYKTMSYMDTLYGHTQAVTCLDAIQRNRLLTVGEDGTARFWKITEESHLLFKHPPVPLDACCFIDAQHFVTGSQDGVLRLFKSTGKSALFEVPNAHAGQWITALKCVPDTNLIFSGATGGTINAWLLEKTHTHYGKLRLVKVRCTYTTLRGKGGHQGGENKVSRRFLGGEGGEGDDDEEDEDEKHTDDEEEATAIPTSSESTSMLKMPGVINCIEASAVSGLSRHDGGGGRTGGGITGVLAIAVGREHKLGRWSNVSGLASVTNGLGVFRFKVCV